MKREDSDQIISPTTTIQDTTPAERSNNEDSGSHHDPDGKQSDHTHIDDRSPSNGIKEEDDALVVDWDGPSDPLNPRKYVTYMLPGVVLNSSIGHQLAGLSGVNGQQP